MESPNEQPTETGGVSHHEARNTFFAEDEERKEVAVGLALSGQSLDDALKPLKDAYDLKVTAGQTSFDAKSSDLKASIDANEAAVQQRSATIVDVKNKIEHLRVEDHQLNTRHSELQSTNQDAWQQIRRARFTHGKEFFKEHETHLEGELHKNRQEILAETDHRFEISRKHHEVDKQNREENKEEFARRVEVCNQEKSAVETQLAKALEYADKLKTIGVTRTTATFLFVVGFISLAGSGSAISSLISDRQPGEPIFSLLLRHLITYGQANIHGPWRVVVLVLLAPTIVATMFFGLLALYVFLQLVDRLVKRFDPSWHSTRGERREPRRSPLQDQFSSLTSQLTGLPSQFGTFRNFEVDRKHYTKLLASFPYILIGGVIFILFSGVAFDDSGGHIAINLTTTFIGVTIVLVATAFWVVYITRVIEPRWKKAADNAPGNNRAPRQLWLNRELAALLFLLVLALGLAAFLPTSGQGTYFTTSQYKHMVWGFVALFMAFGSLGLAYGVIQRGIFKDVDFLSRKRDSYRYWIERYSARPTIEDASTYLDDISETPISVYLDRRGDLYRSQLSYELNEIFADDFEDEQPALAIQNLWRRLGFNGKANRPPTSLRLKNSPPVEPRLID
jgi:hypothetical protein